MKKYYECHLTFMATQEEYDKVTTNPMWGVTPRFSRIDGDPILGEGIKSYITFFANERVELDTVIHLLNAYHTHLDAMGINVIRKKIELVVYDVRVSQ